MKLYIAVAGSSQEDVKNNLLRALKNIDEFTDDNAFCEEYDESKKPGEDGHVLYQIDYQWSEDSGTAMLADMDD